MKKEKLIELVGITKSFGSEQVLKDLDLYILDNEFITIPHVQFVPIWFPITASECRSI